jgi:PA14 domain
MPGERIPRVRLGCYFVCSLALHGALVALVSSRSCGGDRPSIATPSDTPVNVELTASLPLPRTRTARPGGCVPATRADSPPHAAHHAPARGAEAVEPKPDPDPPPADATPDEAARMAARVVARVDAVAAPSRRSEPADDKVDAAARAAEHPGKGTGAHGGPGGRGAGAGGAKVPVVSREFAFGRDTPGAFKGVACFIRPGVLRIADVHGCAPVAVFYTDSFNVQERQQVEGFPGISDRSTWFMIAYEGAFTVGKEGSYDFRLHSDDGSYLFIDGTLVIENDGKHKPESRSGRIALGAGSHQLRILYAQTTDRMALQLFVHRPGAFFEELFSPHL